MNTKKFFAGALILVCTSAAAKAEELFCYDPYQIFINNGGCSTNALFPQHASTCLEAFKEEVERETAILKKNFVVPDRGQAVDSALGNQSNTYRGTGMNYQLTEKKLAQLIEKGKKIRLELYHYIDSLAWPFSWKTVGDEAPDLNDPETQSLFEAHECYGDNKAALKRMINELEDMLLDLMRTRKSTLALKDDSVILKEEIKNDNKPVNKVLRGGPKAKSVKGADVEGSDVSETTRKNR